MTKTNLTRAYIYIMLLLYPLFTGFRGYTAITESKLAFYLSATALWLLALLILSLKRRSLKNPHLTGAELCILIYFAICCASALTSPYGTAVLIGAGRFDGLISIALSICILIGISRNAEPENGFVYALAISTTICCIIAALQLQGLNPLKLFPSNLSYYDKGIKYSGEFLGTIGNANLFSAFLSLSLPIITVFFIIGKRKRYFLLPTIALGAYCLFACTVDAGKLALIATALILSPAIILHKTKLNPRRFLITYAAALTITTAAALYYFAKLYGGTAGTLFELSNVLRGNIQDQFGSSRIKIWRECLKLVAQRPLLGGGTGTTALRLDINFSRFVPETGETLRSAVDNPHNAYLGILTDTGIFALIAYLTTMAITLINALKQKKPLALCVACGLLCYWIQDFFSLGLFIVSPLMFIAWGLLQTNRRKTAQTPHP